ncbi:MAG: response regulator transcription factor [Candidatus Merdivicinus sp.]|jgi:two-component system response regulator YesN
MYQVLLVDDEPWVLRGLTEGIPWAQLGFEICAQTSDPTEALTILLDRQPDLVVTDIKMPGISGMDLIRCSREQGGNSNFILFSGYGDFEYAQRAIQYGVFAYLLKPLNQKEFTRTLELLAKSLQGPPTIRETDGLLFLDGDLRIDPTLFESQTDAVCCALTCFLTFSDEIMLEGLFSSLPHVCYRTGSNKYLYFFQADSQQVAGLLTGLLESEAYLEKDYLAFGLSRNFSGISGISAAIRESEAAAGDHFLYPERRLSFYSPADIACCNAWLAKFHLTLTRDGCEAAAEHLEELGRFCQENRLTLLDFGYLHNRILAFLEEMGNGLELEFPAYGQLPQKYADMQEAAEFLTQMLEDVSDRRQPTAGAGGLSDTFEQILQYLQENYSQDISLASLSDRFYINMTYICDLFKKYKSTTFSKYLNNLRLEQAHQLICSTQDTLQEITEAAGYRDYYYFIKQFKKKYGVTPGSLRKTMEKEPSNETSMEHQKADAADDRDHRHPDRGN